MKKTLLEGESVTCSEDKVTIMIVDDHPMMRYALRKHLEAQADFEVIAEAGDGEEVIELATKLIPDVVIMDISLPKVNGLEATRRIKERCPDVLVLALTVHNDSEHILKIFEAGASGYLTKTIYGEEVPHAIRGVVAGESVVSNEVMNKLLKYAIRNPIKPLVEVEKDKLSTRELEILRLLARGMNNKEIAALLDLNLRTVKGHLVNIFAKLNAKSRTEALIIALRCQYLTVNDLG